MRAMLLLVAGIAVAGCSSSQPCGTHGPAMNGTACVSTDDCCFDYEAWTKDPTTILTCSRYGRTCRAASELPLGESCSDSVQCASRNCDPNYHFCTKPCASNSPCDSATACARVPWTSSGGWFCRPTCQVDDDCVVYGPTGAGGDGGALSCKVTKIADGRTIGVCSP